MFASKASPANRGIRMTRTSVAARSVGLVMVPVRNPRPSGLYGTNPIPNSRSVGRMSVSTSRDQSEYSV